MYNDVCGFSFFFFSSNRVYGIIRFKLGKTHDDEERTHCRMYVCCMCMHVVCARVLKLFYSRRNVRYNTLDRVISLSVRDE